MQEVPEQAGWSTDGKPGWRGGAACVWALVVYFGLVMEAVIRLWPIAVEPLGQGMTAPVWACYLAFVAFNAYAEGYRGFQRAFVPRLVARLRLLAFEPTTFRVWLAPLFIMGLVQAPRRRLLSGWMLVLFIVCAIVYVRSLSQPWRGVIDAGVVVGLAWGLLTSLVQIVVLLRGTAPRVDPEIPPVATGS